MNNVKIWHIPNDLSLNLPKTQQLEQCLIDIHTKHNTIKLASSLGAEDMLLTHMILTLKLNIKIFVLDTQRLHTQTLDLIQAIYDTYNYKVEVFTPQTQPVAEYISQHGLNAFYESLEMRKKCCYIRKVEPLQRALNGIDAWLTGQRQSQSTTRSDLSLIQKDDVHNNIKYNPLFEWSDNDVWAYIKHYNVPFNQLHNKGYPSIGCEPCTRAILFNEDIRAGRWWWEDTQNKECGLHK